MPRMNAEPIRRTTRQRRRPNSVINLFQVLSRNCGKPWSQVRTMIDRHHGMKDPRLRSVIRERLDALLARRRRDVRAHHVFRVNRDGIVERITN